MAVLEGERDFIMKPLHDLNSAASDFESCIMLDLQALKRYRQKMYEEKDTGKIKNIYQTLENLEDDVYAYMKWAEREAESIEKDL